MKRDLPDRFRCANILASNIKVSGNHYLLRITAFMFEFTQLNVIIILLSLKEF